MGGTSSPPGGGPPRTEGRLLGMGKFGVEMVGFERSLGDMGLFPRKRRTDAGCGMLQSVPRFQAERSGMEVPGMAAVPLYAGLRRAVPVIDAAIGKIVRLTGNFRLVCSDARMEQQLDDFCRHVPVGLTGQSLQTFADGYLDSLLTYGNALGEMLVDWDSDRLS